MKYIGSFILCFIISTCIYSQVFKSEKAHFSMQCPKGYKSEKIINAPHMVLKLENGNNTIGVSCWDYGLDDSYNMWNNDIIEANIKNLRNMPNASLLASEKCILSFKNGKVKAFKSKWKSSQNLPSFSEPLVINYIFYQYIFKGDFIQFTFAVDGNSNVIDENCEKILSSINLIF